MVGWFKIYNNIYKICISEYSASVLTAQSVLEDSRDQLGHVVLGIGWARLGKLQEVRLEKPNIFTMWRTYASSNF